MQKTVELKLLPGQLNDSQLLVSKLARLCGQKPQNISSWRVLRRSIDARGARPFYRLRVEVFMGETPDPEPALLDGFKEVAEAAPVIIVGAGPAGYFAALELIEQGLKPVIFDRGKDVQSRRRDLRAIQQFGVVNPHSNYCFGEGGAGTYSDGKLYTRSHKRGSVYKALKLLVEHGASADILVDAHPHIGSNKLPKIVANIRQTILHYGGEIHFDSQVTDFVIRQNRMEGVVVNQKTTHFARAVLLATGHSARDIFELLHRKNIRIEPKPFALGVRIEHPQSLIDAIQYKQNPREEGLPAASYKLTCQVGGRGVFSFCMCPGGLIVPAATAPGEIVVNGMSMSRRDSAFANSGTVVAVEPEDLAPFEKYGVFAGLEFQKSVEKAVFDFGDGSQKAPSQRLTDFVKGRLSRDLPPTSYIPGVYSAPVHRILPPMIYQKLRDGALQFGKKMKGYLTEETNVVPTESRTSSPIRIPRDRATFMHEQIEGLFPCGEGAGYAGGIISAAMDGQNVARAIRAFYHSVKV
ncbi:MAG: FAD-binding protein [Bacteroidetes bacterium]|nr:MAG: FAD-binding protein [Bacteroidota bacterium]